MMSRKLPPPSSSAPMTTMMVLLAIACLLLLRIEPARSFAPATTTTTTTETRRPSFAKPWHSASHQSLLSSNSRHHEYGSSNLVALSATGGGGGEDKFSPFQRIESIKTGIIGLLAGGIASAPFIGLHDLQAPIGGLASWEFDTDMASLMGALFAIVYRYCIREEDDNDMLNMGVVGAFVVVRTLSRIRVPTYCTAVPLDCGDPLGYFDYDMLGQLALNGLESAALFGGAAAAMEYAYDKKWISKFPN